MLDVDWMRMEYQIVDVSGPEYCKYASCGVAEYYFHICIDTLIRVRPW